MQGFEINENIRLLFIKALNDINQQLKSYSLKQDANKDYIKRRNRQVQDMFNFYNEVENILQNRKFSGDLFIYNAPAADIAELTRLQAENRRLREQLKGLYTKPLPYASASEREAFRHYHNSKQREIFNY